MNFHPHLDLVLQFGMILSQFRREVGVTKTRIVGQRVVKNLTIYTDQQNGQMDRQNYDGICRAMQ